MTFSTTIMRSRDTNSSPEKSRRPARDVINAVLENMRKNLEPLKYSTVVPSRYLVYLHPNEYARLEGIIEIVREQTIRALSEEIGARNRHSVLRRYVYRILPDRSARVENPGGDWSVEFLPNPDGDIPEGDILVDSELLLPATPELGVGERTRLVSTIHSARKRQSLAKIEYDDTSGHHSYDVRDSVTIGRGGAAYPVDIRIVSSVDVSREHARIRRDAKIGGFFLIDLSTLGTTLNGRHVPRGYDEIAGTRRENGAETVLPDNARIGLADTVYLTFCLVRE
jgi:hypothetical protein